MQKTICLHTHNHKDGIPMTIEHIHTYCAMCVSRCGVVATVEDGHIHEGDRRP